jgi:hypothetical protein
MYRDIFFGLFYFITSFIGALVNTKIKDTNSSIVPAIIMSQIYMLGGIMMLKYSDLSLVKQSAIITLMSRFGYIIGLVWVGESILQLQWIGIIIMIIGTYLTNYR